MVAAGYDLPYIQAQVGDRDPTTTLAIYAQLIASQDRDRLRTEIRQLLGTEASPANNGVELRRRVDQARPGATRLRASDKAGKGRGLHL